MHPSIGALQGIERLPIVWDKCKWIIKMTGISSIDGKLKIAKFSRRTLCVTFSLMSLSRNLPFSIIERIMLMAWQGNTWGNFWKNWENYYGSFSSSFLVTFWLVIIMVLREHCSFRIYKKSKYFVKIWLFDKEIRSVSLMTLNNYCLDKFLTSYSKSN